jgi:diketogulonate reductase-like aldo/keto reductase
MTRSAATRAVSLPGGETIAALGQGTWHMAERPQCRKDEIAALRLGIELGLTLIDTAEMYADGAAEELVGEAIAGLRERVFLVSKVLPANSTRRGTIAACQRSLERLRTDRLDLYLLHWRGDVPLAETLEAFAHLVEAGQIRFWGVSNFSTSDLDELLTLPAGKGVAVNQVLYNLTRRGIEYDLLPQCLSHHVPIMAYSPVEQGRLLGHPVLAQVAKRHGVNPAQVALAWAVRNEAVIAIPKAASETHVRENRAALSLVLEPDDLAALDRAFPPPTGPRSLEML